MTTAKPKTKTKTPVNTKDVPKVTKRGPRAGYAPKSITKAQAAKNATPRRVLSPIRFAKGGNASVFPTVEAMQDAATKYRDLCNDTGDIPTVKGFCLFCGRSSKMLAYYVDHKDPEFSEAARIIKDWIYEQKEHATSLGFYPLNLMIWTCVNEHNCVNTRTYTETDNKTQVNERITLESIINKADSGGLPAPPSAGKRRLPAPPSADKRRVIELDPIQCTKGQSRPGTKAAERSKKKRNIGINE